MMELFVIQITDIDFICFLGQSIECDHRPQPLIALVVGIKYLRKGLECSGTRKKQCLLFLMSIRRLTRLQLSEIRYSET